MTEKKSYIPSRLKNASVGGHVAGAADIIDDALNKTQEEINGIVLTPSTGIDDRLKTIEQGVTFEGTIQTETNPANVTSGSAKVPTGNAVRGAIDVRTGFFTCSTDGGTAAKAVTANGYVLSRGGGMRIFMEHANTADNATLNINSTGAKALFYNGERAGSDNTWGDEETITVYYDETANSNAGAYFASNAQGGGGKAEKIKYDNSQSGLIAENVQSAVDELAQNGDLYEDCLANCIHEASSTEITTTISNANLVNKNASWSTSSNGRLILTASALIDVAGANRIKLAVSSSAVESGSNIVQYTLPMYDLNKTYLLSLDLGWKAIGTVPYIEIDLTSSTYANVAYVGLYLGASNATTQIYNTDVNPSGITYTLYMPAFYTTKAVDEEGLEDYINNYDVLSNCHHSTGGGVVTEGVESTSFMNGLQNWTASQIRITLIKSELIDVFHIVSVTVTIPYSAVSSDTNIDRCQIPFYSTNKTYLGSLDPGWTYFNGDDVTITYDLTSPDYANVGYLGCYFGSDNVNISPSSIDASGIEFALTQEAEYTTKAVDELMLEDFAQTAGVRTMANYTGEKVVITPKYDYKEVFNMPAASQSRQGAAIYGNYLFQCFNTNAYVQVWNLSNKSLVQTINLSEDASNHAAGASFGKFYDSTDPFPLLYIAAFNSNYIYVYRITGTVGSLTMSLIQTITIDSSLMYLPNMVIDRENMKMILYGYNINSYSQAANNYLKFAVLDVPSTDSDLTITQSELDRQFTIPYRFACQDAVAYYGKMLMFWGYAGNVQGSGFIQVDYTNGLLVSDANTNTMLDNADEIQGVGIWNGGIITTSYLGTVRLLEF